MNKHLNDVVIVGAARTAIGSFGGALKNHSACDLGALVVKAAFDRAGFNAARAGQIVMGNVLHSEGFKESLPHIGPGTPRFCRSSWHVVNSQEFVYFNNLHVKAQS